MKIDNPPAAAARDPMARTTMKESGWSQTPLAKEKR